MDKETWFQIREFLTILIAKNKIIEWNITSEDDIFFKYEINDKKFEDYVKISKFKEIELIIDKTELEFYDKEQLKKEDEREYIRNCCPNYGIY